MGDGRGTWTAPNGSYWPAIVAEDFDLRDFDVYVYSYSTAVSGDCTLIPDLSEEMRLRLEPLYASYEEVDFVAHSMGGLVIREMLLTYGGVFVEKTRSLAFFGTPGGGSALADKASFLTDCADDLRRLKANSFLKQQVKKWQQGQLSTRVRTTCGLESNGLIVDASSSMLLCDESATIFTSHVGLVKPTCREDLSHIVLKKALRPARSVSRADIVDPDLVRLLHEQQTMRAENRLLEFWNALGDESGGRANEALMKLRESPIEDRIGLLQFAVNHKAMSGVIGGRLGPFLRAIVGADASLRSRIHDEIFPAWRREPTSPAVVQAIMILDQYFGFGRPPQNSTSDRDAYSQSRADFLSVFSQWPRVLRAFDAALADRAAGRVRRAHLIVLRQLDDSERSAVAVAYVEAMRNSSYTEKGSLCDACDILGVRADLSKMTLESGAERALLASLLLTRDCVGESNVNAELTRLVATAGASFKLPFSTFLFTDQQVDYLMRNRTAYLDLSVFIQFATAAELDDLACKLVAALPTSSFNRFSLLASAIDRRPELSASVLEPFVEASPYDDSGLVLAQALARNAPPAAASQLWNAIKDVSITDPKRTLGRFIVTGRLLSDPSRSSPTQRREIAQHVWHLVVTHGYDPVPSNGDAATEIGALGTFAWELSDDEIKTALLDVLRTADAILASHDRYDSVFRVFTLLGILEQRLPFSSDIAFRIEELRVDGNRLARAEVAQEQSEMHAKGLVRVSPYRAREYPVPFLPSPLQEDATSSVVRRRLSDDPRAWLLDKVRSLHEGGQTYLTTVESETTRLKSLECCDDPEVVAAITSLWDRRDLKNVPTTTIDDYDDVTARLVSSLPPRITFELKVQLDKALSAGPATAPDLRLRLAIGCTEPREIAWRDATAHVLATTDDSRDARLAAATIRSCAPKPHAIDMTGVEQNISRLFGRARSVDDLRRLLDTLDLLGLNSKQWHRVVWAALVPLLVAQPDRPVGDAQSIMRRVPAPSVEVVADVINIPILNYGVEWIALRQAGRFARKYFSDYWDFIAWWAADRGKAAQF
jgi:hypothetical protein